MNESSRFLDSDDARRSEIDLLKGAAIVGVLFVHASFYSRFDSKTIETVGAMQLLFGWCVIAFFYLSGALARTPRSWDQFRSFAAARFNRLLIPCLVFSFSYNLILEVLSHFDLVGQRNEHGGGVLSFLWLFFPASPQFYFLPYLFLISVLLHLVDLVLRPLASFFLALGLLLLAYLRIGLPLQPHGSEVALLPIYAYAYAAGHFSSTALANNRLANSAVQSMGPLLCALLNSSPIFLYLLVPVLILEAFRGVSRRSFFGLGTLGRWSGGIYVWHTPIVMPAASIIAASVFGGGLFGLAATMLLTIAVSISLSWTTYQFRWLRPWRF